jgi:OPT family oligopeptide transporter
MARDDHDWDSSGADMEEAIGKEAPQGQPGSARHQDPVEDLKARLSMWGESARYKPSYDDEEEEGSEYELLLDPNLPDEYEPKLADFEQEIESLDDDEVALKHREDGEEPEDSPYPEVRAAVRNYDEDVPCNTVRAWTIGLTLVVVGASMNTLFSLRTPSIGLGALIAQIIAWPMGHGWARVMPERKYRTFGLTWSLNPGPFNIKEHSIIVVMASVSFSVAYATDIVLAQLVFYKQDFGIPWQLMLTISTQSLGYGIAGMMRKFLGMSPPQADFLALLTHFEVYPASMIWPGNLVSVTLMNAMYEKNEKPDPTVIGGRMPRYYWFGLITICSFIYYFIPGFLAQFLSSFAFMTWIFPDSPVVNQLFGFSTGLSIIPITFDWTQISGFVGSPLIPPW